MSFVSLSITLFLTFSIHREGSHKNMYHFENISKKHLLTIYWLLDIPVENTLPSARDLLETSTHFKIKCIWKHSEQYHFRFVILDQYWWTQTVQKSANTNTGTNISPKDNIRVYFEDEYFGSIKGIYFWNKMQFTFALEDFSSWQSLI